MGLGMVDRDIEVGKEYKVGTFTLNGVTYDRYLKIVDCGALPNNTSKNVAHGITFIGIIGISGWSAYYTNPSDTVPTYVIPIPSVNAVSSILVGVYITPSNIVITGNYDLTTYHGYVILEYFR